MLDEQGGFGAGVMRLLPTPLAALPGFLGGLAAPVLVGTGGVGFLLLLLAARAGFAAGFAGFGVEFLTVPLLGEMFVEMGVLVGVFFRHGGRDVCYVSRSVFLIP